MIFALATVNCLPAAICFFTAKRLPILSRLSVFYMGVWTLKHTFLNRNPPPASFVSAYFNSRPCPAIFKSFFLTNGDEADRAGFRPGRAACWVLSANELYLSMCDLALICQLLIDHMEHLFGARGITFATTTPHDARQCQGRSPRQCRQTKIASWHISFRVFTLPPRYIYVWHYVSPLPHQPCRRIPAEKLFQWNPLPADK